MKSSDIVKTFKKFPDKGTMEIRQVNNLIVLSDEDYGIYNCERYTKQMNGTLKKDDDFPKAANVLYDPKGNVSSIIYYDGYCLHDVIAIHKFKYNENNDMIEENVMVRNLGTIDVSYYKYDQLGRIISKIDHRDYNTRPKLVTTYSYMGDDDTVRYINESKYNDSLTVYSNQIWFDNDGIMLYSIKVDKDEGVILSSKYKYNKKKDSYRCKTTEIEF